MVGILQVLKHCFFFPFSLQDVRDELRRLLDEHTALQSSPDPLPQDQQLGYYGRALVTGAEYVCKGMDMGAKKVIKHIITFSILQLNIHK